MHEEERGRLLQKRGMMTAIPLNVNDNGSSVAYMNGDPIAYMEVLSQACIGIQERLKARGKVCDDEVQDLIREVDFALTAIDEHLNSEESEEEDDDG